MHSTGKTKRLNKAVFGVKNSSKKKVKIGGCSKMLLVFLADPSSARRARAVLRSPSGNSGKGALPL